MKRLSAFAVTLMLALAATAQERPRVLFIGNSYTDVNNLPQMVSDVARSMGDEMSFASNTPGGCTFQQHCTNQSMQMICQGGWDVVVLQEQSQYPSFPQSQVEAEVFPYAERLVDSIYAHNPCAEPMFYMTWGRRDGDQQNAQFFPVLGTYEGMDSMLCLRYTYMAEANDASLCPVGRVWRQLRRSNPEIELYSSDGSHPSVAGTYAAACAFYTLIFHRDPMEISYSASLEPDVATTIRDAVRRVVFDNLARWQRPMPEVVMVLPEQEGQTVLFSASCSNADSLRWDFGDGTDTAVAVAGLPMVEHTYADSGSYVVSVTALRHCLAAADTVTVTVTLPGGNGIQASEPQTVSVYPNPATGSVTVSLGTPSEAVLLSPDGREVWRGHVDGTATIPLRTLAAGSYLLRVGDTVKTVVKR